MEQLPIRHPGRPELQPAGDSGAARQVTPYSPPHGGFVEIAPPDDSADEWAKWLGYLRALQRRKLTLVTAALCGVVLSAVYTLRQMPLYVSGTTLEIQQVSDPPFEGISFLNSFDPYLLTTQVQLLRSGVLQGRVVQKLIDQGEPQPQIAVPAPDAAPAAPGPAKPLLTRLGEQLGLTPPTPGWQEAIYQSTVSVSPMKDTRIVQVVTQSPVPALAAAYANAVAAEFIQQNQEERWSLYQKTGLWLDRAQEDLKAKLEESEKQLLAYASASGLVVTSNNQGIAEQRVVQMQTEASRAQAERIVKEAAYRTVMGQPSDALADVLDHGVLGQYGVNLTDLRRQLAEASATLTDAHPKVKRLEAQIAELESARSRESTSILNRMRTDYETALRREQQLAADLERESRLLSEQDQKLIRYKTLEREVETYRKLYDTTLQRGKEASVASALSPVNIRVVDAARVPVLPASPNVTRSVFLGLFGGLVLGAGFVLMREWTDASVRTPGSVSMYLNRRELGVIPSAAMEPGALLALGQPNRSLSGVLTASFPGRARPRQEAADSIELVTWTRKTSQAAESFRSTLASILSVDQNGHRRQVLLVTSASPQEGKSTVSANLAVALAEISGRVLLIDGDLRRPRLHTILKQGNTWGLSDVLRDKIPCTEYPIEALTRKTIVPGLSFMPSGPATANVSRLLYSARLTELLERLRGEFDAVLIDTPPVLRVADARILARLADAVVLVVRAGQTTREAAATAANLFDEDGVPLLGTVLNDWNPHTMGHGYYPATYGAYYREASSL